HDDSEDSEEAIVPRMTRFEVPEDPIVPKIPGCEDSEATALPGLGVKIPAMRRFRRYDGPEDPGMFRGNRDRRSDSPFLSVVLAVDRTKIPKIRTSRRVRRAEDPEDSHMPEAPASKISKIPARTWPSTKVPKIPPGLRALRDARDDHGP